jgi:hypothetical protein
MNETKEILSTLKTILSEPDKMVVLIGPRWTFVLDFMARPLLNIMEDQVLRFRQFSGDIYLANGSKVISISSQEKYFHRVLGLSIDKIWVHGSLSKDQREYLEMALRGKKEKLIQTH